MSECKVCWQQLSTYIIYFLCQRFHFVYLINSALGKLDSLTVLTTRRLKFIFLYWSVHVFVCACVCMFGHHSQIESSKDLSSNNIGYVKLTFEAIQNHRRFSKCTVCNFWLNVTISSDIVRYWLWMAWTRFFLTLIWTPIFADEYAAFNNKA